MPYQGYVSSPTFGQPAAAPRACDNRSIPSRPAARDATKPRVACTSQNAFHAADPFAVIKKAAGRAVEMLDNTITELVKARTAICGGAALPSLRNLTAD